MQKLRKEGWTLLEIGEKYKISKERVRQILDEKDG
jgi:DNA-directed RNA polymerase sigma subunit (sigma70/sigma32)